MLRIKSDKWAYVLDTYLATYYDLKDLDEKDSMMLILRQHMVGIMKSMGNRKVKMPKEEKSRFNRIKKLLMQDDNAIPLLDDVLADWNGNKR